MARMSAAEKQALDRMAPELVKVRALYRGYYAVAEVFDFPQFDGTKKRELGRNNVIRNEGEVFMYDLNDAPLASSLKPHQLTDRETVKSTRGEVVLPRWMTQAGKREKETVAAGHTKTFGEANVAKDDDDVL